MEDEKMELKILKETIEHLKNAKECMNDCESIPITEYNLFAFYIQELEDRAMELEIKINGCIIEEV